MKRIGPIAGGLLLLIAGVIAGLGALLYVRRLLEVSRHTHEAALREPAAQAQWRKEFGDPATVLALYPRRPNNAAAVRLIELARAVGADLAIPKRFQNPRVARGSPTERSMIAIGDYDRAELTTIRGAIRPPADSVRSFQQAHRQGIDEIVRFLSTSSPPAWEMDTSFGPEAPIPNLLGQIRLQRLLIAEALSDAQLGSEAEAARAFRASWNLNASLFDRPDTISQTVAMSVARMQVALARRLYLDPDEWRKRLADHDFRASVLRSIEVEMASRFRILFQGPSLEDRASRTDFIDMARSLLEAVRDSPVSDGIADRFSPKLLHSGEPLSAGEVLSQIALSNIGSLVRRADRLVVDMELTDRVLEAKSLRAAIGRWPEEIPDLAKSQMLNAHWIYDVNGDGRMTISLSRELAWGESERWILPLRFESD